MLTSGKVNFLPQKAYFFTGKTPLHCLKIVWKILWKMLTTFVDKQHFIPISTKLIPTTPASEKFLAVNIDF